MSMILHMEIKQKLFNLIRATKLKSIVVLTSGVFIAQLIGIVIQPIATRLYSAEMFGKLALMTSLVTMLSPVMTLQYEQFIVVVSTDQEANILTALALHVELIMGVILGVGIITYNHFFPYIFSETGMWIYFSIPALFITAFAQILTMYNIRHEEYKLIASVSVIRSTFSSLVKIILGILRFSYIGLIASYFISSCAGIKRQAKFLLSNLNEIRLVNKSEMLQVAKKYMNQPLFSTPGLFVNSFSYSILPIVITAMYGIKETGLFSQSMLMLGLPLVLISGSVGQVFFKNASKERAEKGSFYSSFKNTTLLLLLISIVPFTCLWFFAEPLFSLAFGAQWLKSGTFVKLLVPMYFVRFTVTALTEALVIAEKQRLKFLIQCMFVIEAMLAYIIARSYRLPIEGFLTIINYLYMSNYIFNFLIVMYESKRKILIEDVETL